MKEGGGDVHFCKIVRFYEEKNLFSYKYLSRNENVLKTISRVCVSFEDYCYKNCKIDSGTRIQEFQLNHFSNDPRDYLFFKGSEISWLLFSQTTTWNQSCIHYTGEEEFFMWIIFFENNGRRMFATCAYPGFGNDYVSRGFL